MRIEQRRAEFIILQPGNSFINCVQKTMHNVQNFA